MNKTYKLIKLINLNNYRLIDNPLYFIYGNENDKYILIDIKRQSSVSLSEEDYKEIKKMSEEELDLLFELREIL